MIQVSKAFADMLKTDAMPEILAILSSSTDTRWVFGKTRPSVGQPFSFFWDGLRTYGQGTYGGDIGLIDSGARVLNFGSITSSIAYSQKDLLLSLTYVEMGSMQVVFDNADGYFSDLLGGDKAVSFLNFNLQITCGFPSLGFSENIELFNGTISEEKLTNKTLSVVAEAQSPSLLETFTLPRAGRYTSPKNENDILPYIYGNTAENSGQGVSVCPCIDTVNNVFCLAAHELPGTAGITLYEDDEEITSGYTVDISDDYESEGTIATATFTTMPTGTISMTTTKGKDSLTNPIDILEDILTETGDRTARNSNSWNTATVDAAALGYVAAGVLSADQPPSYWMTNILTSFLGSWYLNAKNEIVISLDSSRLQSNIAGILREYNARGISGSRTRQNLCNQLFLNYAYSLTDVDRRFKQNVNPKFLKYEDGNTTKDEASQAKYGEVLKTLDLQWVRNTTTAQALQTRIVDRYALPIWTISFPEQAIRNILIEPGDFVAYSWEAQEDIEGEPVKNQIARILKINRDLDALTITFELIDSGIWMTVDPYIWDGSHTYGETAATYGANRDRRVF